MQLKDLVEEAITLMKCLMRKWKLMMIIKDPKEVDHSLEVSLNPNILL